MDRRAWGAIVHRVAKSRTLLKRHHTCTHAHVRDGRNNDYLLRLCGHPLDMTYSRLWKLHKALVSQLRYQRVNMLTHKVFVLTTR